MYIMGVRPMEFTELLMVPIPKVKNTLEYKENRTITLIVHASTIMLRILKRRVEAKALSCIGKP